MLENLQWSNTVKPPSTKRGVENTETLKTIDGQTVDYASQMGFRVHWMEGNTYLELSDVLKHLVASTGYTDHISSDRYINKYKTVHSFLGGAIKVLSEPAIPETMPDCHMIITGQGCDALGHEKLKELSSILKPTRMDLAFDYAPFTPKQLYEWAEQGQVRCRAKKHGWHSSGDRYYKDNTFYLGTRESTWHLCAYDERGYTRIELRLRKERAELAYNALMDSYQHFKDTSLGWLREFCDFIDTSTDSNKSRAPPPKTMGHLHRPSQAHRNAPSLRPPKNSQTYRKLDRRHPYL